MRRRQPPPGNIVHFPRVRRACIGCGARIIPQHPSHKLCARCYRASAYAAAIARYLAGEAGDDDR